MEDSTPSRRRTLTPSVLASALFVVACAVFAVTFVAARGGLQMPIAPSGSEAAVASGAPSPAPSMPAEASDAPSPSPGTTPEPTIVPSTAPTATPIPTAAASPDPLTALPGCPKLPGCYEYVVGRNDTLSRIASRYAIPLSTVLALNPEITDPSTIVIGHTVYLGRDPFVRLEPCPDVPDCALYVIRPGDRLASIAGRFGITVDAILAVNPAITDANAIYSGQVIRLPRSAP